MHMANGEEHAAGKETLILLLLAFAGYLLPWIIAPNAAMTLNAFDLAEWTSLHPIQQHQAMPPLIAPLLLRAQLPIIAAIITLWFSEGKARFLALLFVVLLAVAQVPPLEFLQNTADPNYRQQSALAIATIILSIGLRLIPSAQLRSFVTIVIAAAGIVTSLLGQSQALELYHVTLEQGETGGGLLLILVAYGAFAFNALRSFLRRR